MAGEISSLPAATSLDWTDLVEVTKDPAGTPLSRSSDMLVLKQRLFVPRGALVRKASAQLTADYTVLTAVAWDSEDYDTDACHDNSSNNTRLSVPSGWSWVRLGMYIGASLDTADRWRFGGIRKDGTTYITALGLESGATGTDLFVTTPPISVTGGSTYFEALFQTENDTSITISTLSCFWIELLA